MSRTISLVVLGALFPVLTTMAACGGGDDADVSDAGSDSTAPESALSVFVLLDVTPGGGLSAMDALCDGAESRPSSSATYKALLASPSRYPCTSPLCENGSDAQDWPLAADTTYVFDGDVLFTTDSNAIVTETPYRLLDPAGRNPWSGGTGDWQVAENHCNDWTTSDDSAQGSLGWTGGPERADFFGGHGNWSCERSTPMICVEVGE